LLLVSALGERALVRRFQFGFFLDHVHDFVLVHGHDEVRDRLCGGFEVVFYKFFHFGNGEFGNTICQCMISKRIILCTIIGIILKTFLWKVNNS